MQTAKINMVSLLVNDLAQARAYWTKNLGFREVAQFSSPDFAMLEAGGGLQVGLHEPSALHGLAQGPTTGAELGVVVDDVDAQWTAWERTGALAVMPPTDLPFGRACRVRDADGNLVLAYRLKARPA